MTYDGSDARAEYIRRMEQIIAKHCSSKNYTFGNYRFPVHYRKDGKNYKTNGDGLAKVSMNEIPSMNYTFGIHKMEIGKALLEILDFLEDHLEDVRPFDYYDDGRDDE